ncbi:MAG: hypothetical protein ACYDDF_14115 [Thermoplasmatota archaeon]
MACRPGAFPLAVIVLIAVAATALLGLPPASAQNAVNLTLSSYRFDFGSVLPGSTHGGNLTVHNAGSASTQVRLTHDNTTPAFVNISTDAFTLAPGDERVIPFGYSVPSDAPPGDHSEGIEVLAGAAAAQSGASLTAYTEVLFTSYTTSVGLLGIESPKVTPPGLNLTGRVLVVNEWTAGVTITTSIEARFETNGTLIAHENLSPVFVDSAGEAGAHFSLPTAASQAGTWDLTARVVSVSEPNAPRSATRFDTIAFVGVLAGHVRILSVVDNGDGTATVTAQFSNTGTVPIEGAPFLNATSGNETRSTLLDALNLSPGATVTRSVTITLPAGSWALEVALPSEDANATAGPATSSFLMHAPRPPPPPTPLALLADFAASYGVYGIAAAGIAIIAYGSYRLGGRRR